LLTLSPPQKKKGKKETIIGLEDRHGLVV
jgi:hypothetical protein